MTESVKLEQLAEWRRGEVQAIGAAISTRNWHSLEAAYNALRDKMDRVIHALPATRHQPQEREAVLEEAARRLEREWPGPASNIVRALKATPAPAVSRDDQALFNDICDKMAEVVAPLPGIPDAPGDAGTRAIEPSDGDKR